MKSIKYTPDAADKLRDIKREVSKQYEKEDFMWQLFGIETTPQETIEYWEE